MMTARSLPAWLLVALAMAPAISAEDGQLTAPSLSGEYDSATSNLLLSWIASEGTPEGSTYTVYLNGDAFANTTGLSLQVDISTWLEGAREYSVSVSAPSGAVSPPGQPLRVLKDAYVPSECPVASLSIYTKPPGAEYAVYPECLTG